MRFSKRISFLTSFGVLFVNWMMFQGDARHSGVVRGLEFPSGNFDSRWTFSLRSHVWKYEPGTAVWSSQAVSAAIGGRTMVYIGAYDKCVYAINAADGSEQWRYITGGPVASAPCVALLDKRYVLLAGSSDRTMYAIDAVTGEKIWSYEFYQWRYTVAGTVVSSPVTAVINGETYVYFGAWINDKLPLKTVQNGEVFCLAAATGKKIWQIRFSGAGLTSPSVVFYRGKPRILVSSNEGRVFCADAATGEKLWERTLSGKIYGSVSASGEMCFIGDYYGMVYCMDSGDGKIIWQSKMGDGTNSTIACYEDKLFVGSFDRCLYALKRSTGEILWRFKTDKYISSSPIVSQVGGRPCVIFCSADNAIYACRVSDGARVWSYRGGDMLWPYERKGVSLHPSPSVIGTGNGAMLLFPSYDGKLYAFSAGYKGARQ
jgi:outer membrane protein assembly factor BamB